MVKYSSLSHSTLTVSCRNITGGVKGCACEDSAVAGSCSCKAKRILDSDGNYSLTQLKEHDREFFIAVVEGLEWESSAATSS